jgi:hypothetical protein
LKKKNFFSPSPLSSSARWPFQPSRPARLHASLLTPPLLFLRAPAQSGSATTARAALLPATADHPGPFSSAVAHLPLHSYAHGRGETVAAPRPLLASWEHPTLCPGFKRDPHLTLLPCCPSPLYFRSRNRTHRATAIHRRAHLPHRLGRCP